MTEKAHRTLAAASERPRARAMPDPYAQRSVDRHVSGVPGIVCLADALASRHRGRQR